MAFIEILPASAFKLNIDALVSSILAVEQRPLIRLQASQNSLSLKSATLSDLKSSLSTVRSKAQTLVQTGSLSPFQAKAVTSSNTAVATATASSSALSGVHALSVTQLAKASTVVSKQLTLTGTDVVTTEGAGTKSFAVTFDGTDPATSGTAVAVSVTVGAGDTNNTILTNLATAINNNATLGAKVNASVVSDTSGTARLVLASKQTGLANKVRVADAAGGGTLLGTIQLNSETASVGTAGGFLFADSTLDAKFTLDGLAITRSSNSVSDALTGVTINLLGVSTSDATLTVGADKTSIKASVQAFIDAYNSAIKFLKERTAITVSATTSAGSTQVNSVVKGRLAGELTYTNLLSNLRLDVSNRVSTVLAGNPASLADVGITVASDGTLSISDSAKFDSAISGNPAGVTDLFASSNGVATRLISRLDGFVNTGGFIDGSVRTVTSRVSDLNRQITALQARLSRREAAVRKQLASLQDALAALSGQRLFFQ